MSFFPKGYLSPANNVGSKYLKISDGETVKIRILDNFDNPDLAIMGWLVWTETSAGKRPIRRPMGRDIYSELQNQYNEKPKHFWAFAIFNHNTNDPQVWEVTQSTIQGQIEHLADSPSWGDLSGYDISVSRQGAGLDTKYIVTPVERNKLGGEQMEQIKNANFQLEELYAGGSPFGSIETASSNPNSKPNAKAASALDISDRFAHGKVSFEKVDDIPY